MNKHITIDEFLANTDFFISQAKRGKIFIYPTDTIYGIGSLYTAENSEKIFRIKKRDKKKMFSIIAPSFEWIITNYKLRTANYAQQITIELLQTYLDRYHGVTYIFDYNHP
ncbi:Sua5/YciO/YrdC/YwlC family protein [Patescibacteria group bacterium]|nr:Sua5/YciO/YrdC/YwlC family protein [Patescibacteria group bacterium]MBU1758863.1 Sua5/YciO/YrdC/YwlC family protein [Patescibacteria group bacterium]